MLIRVLTLKYNPKVDGFDDMALQSFCANHQVLDVHEEFFLFQGIPHWSFVVRYEAAEEIAEPRQGKSHRDENWRKQLSKEQLTRYDALREWRNERARQEGISPYIIATNRMVAEMIRQSPTTLEELKEVPGFGPAKLENYGKDFLALLNTSPPDALETDSTDAEQTQ